MSGRLRALLALIALATCASCPALGRGEETFEGSPESKDRVPVVDDTGPFDPSEAVDDDDGPVVLDAKDDPTDRPAFSEEAPADPAAAAENEREDPTPPGADREPVASEAEAAAREQAQERAVERANEGAEDEDEAKVALGHNPPPEPTVESEPERTKVMDFVLETLLVAVLAALVSGAVVFARSHPRSVAIAAVLFAGLGAFLLSQRG